MAKATTFLNYIAFFILFITSFIFLFIKNSVVLGYIVAFVTNTFFIFFVFSELADSLDDYTYFIPTISILAILISAILHFVCLVFILTLIYRLRVKYSVKEGMPIMIPEPYKQQILNFNNFMISVFGACVLLLFIVNFRWKQIDINFYEFIKHINLFTFYKNFTLFIALILAAYSLGMSIYQTIVAVSFSKLSRQQLNVSEYKPPT